MSSVSPLSSLSTKNLNSTSLLLQSSPHLLSSQLLYTQFIQASESLNNKQYHQKVSLFCLSSLIALSNGLEAIFLVACNKVEKDTEDFDADLLDEPSEFIGNQVFIEKISKSNSEGFESDKGIIESLDKNSKKSHFASDEKQIPGPAFCRIRSQSILNVWINDCSTKNAKLKLI